MNEQYASDIQRLFKEKDILEQELREAEEKRRHARDAAKRETKLVASAFYDLGLEFHTALLAGRALAPTARGGSSGGGSSSVPGGAPLGTANNPGQSWINQHRARLNLQLSAGPL